MATATLTSKGQVTIPRVVRERLGLKAGDRIDFIFDSDGRIVLKGERIPFEELRGIVRGKRRKPVSQREMDDAIGAAVVARFLRATGSRRKAK